VPGAPGAHQRRAGQAIATCSTVCAHVAKPCAPARASTPGSGEPRGPARTRRAVNTSRGGQLRGTLQGFKAFLLRGNIIDLAIAVVIGAAFNTLVTSLVKNILTPLIAAIGGQPSFQSLTFRIHHSTFTYGQFINDAISFLISASVIYFVVVLPLSKLNERRMRGEVPEQEDLVLSDEARLLIEIRDLLASRGSGGEVDATPSRI
jgi:large conductance mechanosensitive channel